MSAFGEARMEAMQDIVNEAVREKEVEYENRIEVLEALLQEKDRQMEVYKKAASEAATNLGLLTGNIIKEKDQEIEKLKQDLRHYAINVCPDKDRELEEKDREIKELKEQIARLKDPIAFHKPLYQGKSIRIKGEE
jgi:small-conductance mechanosensitive channel